MIPIGRLCAKGHGLPFAFAEPRHDFCFGPAPGFAESQIWWKILMVHIVIDGCAGDCCAMIFLEKFLDIDERKSFDGAH